MKYADSQAASVEISIDAAESVVWALVSDITTPVGLSAELQGAEWLTEGPAVGAQFVGHNKHQAVGEWTTTSTITDYVEGSVFEWTVGDVANKTARWRYDVEPSGSGCLVRFSAEMGPGPSGLSRAIKAMPDREEDIVAGRLREWRKSMSATLEGVKALAEPSG